MKLVAVKFKNEVKFYLPGGFVEYQTSGRHITPEILGIVELHKVSNVRRKETPRVIRKAPFEKV